MNGTRPALFLAALAGLAGCAPKGTYIELKSIDQESGLERPCRTVFTSASYRSLPGGKVELALRAESPSEIDPTQIITEMMYIKQLWRPRPGTSYVEASQINARIEYVILTPPTGVRYDGGAFITGRKDRRTGKLVGRIESGTLKPRYRMGDAVEPFGAATFTGTFEAVEDPARVVDTLQEIETRFNASLGK